MFYSVIKALAFFILKVFFRMEVKGRSNVPKEGGLLVISNHCSQMDPVIIGSVLPRRLYYMAKEELFKIPFLRSLIVALGAFPVRRETGDLRALSKIVDLVKKGEAVLLFPEGSRSEDGEVKEFMHGVSFIAFKAGVPVLPVAVRGSFEAMPKGKVIPKLTKISVRIGELVRVDGLSRRTKEEMTLFTSDLRNRVRDLLRGN